MILDYNKLPRPERSGVLAVLIAYLALCFYGEANWDHSLIDGDWSLSSLACMLFPWECMKQPKAIAHEEEPPPEPRHVTLLYCPSCPVNKHPKRCEVHLDVHFNNHAEDEIFHYYSPRAGPIPCPDPIDFWSEWWGQEGWDPKARYRWHVTVIAP